ncbi:hypothetical protein TNCT_177841, partial [Trichonephila clavata]
MKTVQFECEAKGSRPPHNILEERQLQTQERRNKSICPRQCHHKHADHHATSDDNGKFLYCQADNPAIPGSAIEDGWKLDVHC